MSQERWHIFYQTYHECPEHTAFDTQEQLEDFLTSIDWEKEEGAEIWAIVRGVELEKKVKAWGLCDKQRI